MMIRRRILSMQRRAARVEAAVAVAELLALYSDASPARGTRYRLVAARAVNFVLSALCRLCGAYGSAHDGSAHDGSAHDGCAGGRGGAPAAGDERSRDRMWGVLWAERDRYGPLRMTEQLCRQGIKVDNETVEVIMSVLGLLGPTGRQELRTADGGRTAGPGPDARQEPEASVHKLVAVDMTHVLAAGGNCSLPTVRDAWSHWTVGWPVQDHVPLAHWGGVLMVAAGLRGRGPGHGRGQSSRAVITELTSSVRR
jgi:hypothetical protein